MSTNKVRTRSLPGLGAYCFGLGIIVAATILNLAHDQLSERDIASLPLFLAPLYEASGKFGVTLLLVTTGMTVILLGAVLQRPRRVRVVAGKAVPRAPFFVTPATEEGQGEQAVSNGSLVLQTRKYLQVSLSGNTSYPMPRVPQG